ncbi:hypothetical protein GQ42DRAFT_164867 [Ramicandelaber brevisporus]|nr:hypothetical protein GQ42DRAFT_164867 [Ramicandelaber brevisporus]
MATALGIRRTIEQAVSRQLPQNLARCIGIAALTAANRPKDITALVSDALVHPQQLTVSETSLLVELGRDTIVKVAPMAGFPRAINALGGLLDAIPASAHSVLVSESRRKVASMQQFESNRQRGSELFDQIYTKNSKMLRERLHQYSPDLFEIIINDQYGKVLSDFTYTNAIETELIAVGALVPLDVPGQLKGHIKGALNVGATQEMVDATLELSKSLTSL